MGAVGRLLSVIGELTRRIDEEVEKGYDLSRWGDEMKFFHALQIQAQALIDMTQRAAAALGHAASIYTDAAAFLFREGLIDEEDFRFFKAVVGFRNVVVNEYVSVDLSVVDRILGKREYRRVLTLAEKVYTGLRKRGVDP